MIDQELSNKKIFTEFVLCFQNWTSYISLCQAFSNHPNSTADPAKVRDNPAKSGQLSAKPADKSWSRYAHGFTCLDFLIKCPPWLFHSPSNLHARPHSHLNIWSPKDGPQRPDCGPSVRLPLPLFIARRHILHHQ